MDLRPGKGYYRVDEPISFKVKTNKTAYVYVFNVDDESGKAVMIFPNQYDKDNKVKGGSRKTIPSKNSIFRSDEPGTERVVVIASQSKLSLNYNKIENSKFFDVEKGEFDETTKAIRVESGRDKERSSKVIKELEVEIEG